MLDQHRGLLIHLCNWNTRITGRMIDQDVILFTYDISVFGRKIDWYLTLRNIKYKQCVQPNRMPRPDLEALGIAYRKIPILAIGRDFYCDSRCIIDQLEKLHPKKCLGSKNSFEQGIEKILSTWSQDGGPFARAAQCIPTKSGVMLDPEWTDDRSRLLGLPFTGEKLAEMRPEALAHLKIHLETLEHGLLADGRDFVFATSEPSLADIQAIWVFDWLTGKSMDMGPLLDPEVISDVQYPRVYAWIRRFRKAVESAQREYGMPELLSSDDTVAHILKSDFWQKEGTVDELDPLRLRKGDLVVIFPSDYGSDHRDKGELIALSAKDVVIQSKIKDGDGFIRLHFPRLNFTIQRA